MNVGDFLSVNGSKPVCSDPLARSWNNLKAMMSQAKSVQDWNAIRKAAQGIYSPELINRLDASGFIVSVNPKNEKND